MIEIFWNETRTALMSEDFVVGTTQRLEEWSAQMVQLFDSSIATLRPKVYKALCEDCGYGPQFAFNRIYQFAACNFSTRDGHPDIDDDFNLTIERVSCPIRHKCKAIFCSNETMLSGREIEIVKLFVRGSDNESIAGKLFISKSTVHNHINNIYHKLGFSGQTHPDRLLLIYAYTNKIS